MNKLFKHITNAAVVTLAISTSANTACISLGNLSDQYFNSVYLFTFQFKAHIPKLVWGGRDNAPFPKGAWKCWCTTSDASDGMGIYGIMVRNDISFPRPEQVIVNQYSYAYTPVGRSGCDSGMNQLGVINQAPGGSNVHFNVESTYVRDYKTDYATIKLYQNNINFTGTKYCGFPYHNKPYNERPYAGTYCQLFY